MLVEMAVKNGFAKGAGLLSSKMAGKDPLRKREGLRPAFMASKTVFAKIKQEEPSQNRSSPPDEASMS